VHAHRTLTRLLEMARQERVPTAHSVSSSSLAKGEASQEGRERLYPGLPAPSALISRSEHHHISKMSAPMLLSASLFAATAAAAPARKASMAAPAPAARAAGRVAAAVPTQMSLSARGAARLTAPTKRTASSLNMVCRALAEVRLRAPSYPSTPSVSPRHCPTFSPRRRCGRATTALFRSKPPTPPFSGCSPCGGARPSAVAAA
jgi:hypothetical protein